MLFTFIKNKQRIRLISLNFTYQTHFARQMSPSAGYDFLLETLNKTKSPILHDLYKNLKYHYKKEKYLNMIAIVKGLSSEGNMDIKLSCLKVIFIVFCFDNKISYVKNMLQDEELSNHNFVNGLNDYYNPLYNACRSNYTDILVALLNDQRLDRYMTLNRDYNALGVACMYGHIEITKILLIDPKFLELETSKFILFNVIHYGYLDIVKYLVEEHNFDINLLQMKYGDLTMTPLYMAVDSQRKSIVKFLLEQPNIDLKQKVGKGDSILNIACAYSDTEIVRMLLENGVNNYNEQDAIGWTPFHQACINGCIETTKLLLRLDPQADPNINYRDDESECWPFQLACERNHVEIVKDILNNCDDVKIPSEKFSDRIEEVLKPFRVTTEEI